MGLGHPILPQADIAPPWQTDGSGPPARAARFSHVADRPADAVRASVHGDDLLGLPRQGRDRQVQLLTTEEEIKPRITRKTRKEDKSSHFFFPCLPCVPWF